MSARGLRCAAVRLAFGLAAALPVTAQAQVRPTPAPACTAHAAEAAARSRLAEGVILRVMHAESRGRADAVSPKGAMGCMQIMPATWRDLAARHALGADPWNARLNMIGGALYLAELAARFGFPGAYAAYNAGPARYARHVEHGVPLPAETTAYMAGLAGGASPSARRRAPRGTPPARWQDAALFPAAARDDRAAAAPAASPDSPAASPDSGVHEPERAAPPDHRQEDAARRPSAAAHPLFPLAPRGD